MRKVTFIIVLIYFYSSGIAQTNADKLNLLILTGKYSEAIDLSKKLLKNYPDSANFYYQQALIYKLMYRYPDAMCSIKNAIRLDSTNLDYLSEYGSILLKRNRDKQAMDIFKSIIAKNKYHLYAGLNLSNYYLKNKQIDEARSILTNLFEKDTTNSYFARNLGLCAIKSGNKDKSLYWLKKAIRLDSTDIKAYEYISLVYASIPEFDEALSYLGKATQFDPENKELFIKIGDIDVLRNHNYRAIPAYTKALELDPIDGLISRKLGVCYFKINRYDKAKYYLEYADKLNYADMQVYEYLGDIHNKRSQLDSSIIYYDKALELIKPDAEAIFTLLESKGKSFYKMNEYDKAIKSFDAALKLDFKDFYGKYQQNKLRIDIASIYHDKLNDKSKAIEYYDQVSKPTRKEMDYERIYTATDNGSQNNLSNDKLYEYAQKQINKIKEELFFEGKL